jgi:hypothetical protein
MWFLVNSGCDKFSSKQGMDNLCLAEGNFVDFSHVYRPLQEQLILCSYAMLYQQGRLRSIHIKERITELLLVILTMIIIIASAETINRIFKSN